MIYARNTIDRSRPGKGLGTTQLALLAAVAGGDTCPAGGSAVGKAMESLRRRGLVTRFALDWKVTVLGQAALAEHANPAPGPRARRATVRDDQLPAMLAAYIEDDLTLDQIGLRYGVTREYVRQLLNGYDRTLYKLGQYRRRARVRLRRFVEVGEAERRCCVVCGEMFMAHDGDRRRRKYCSATHHQVAFLLRYQAGGDEKRLAQQRRIAAWNVAHRDQVTAEAYRYSVRVLDGDRTTDRGRRWLTDGSLAFHWALRAYSFGWPIFDRFHPDVQRQVRAAAGENVDWTPDTTGVTV